MRKLARASERLLKTMPALPSSAKLIRKWFSFPSRSCCGSSVIRKTFLVGIPQETSRGRVGSEVGSESSLGGTSARAAESQKTHTHPVLSWWPSLCFGFLFLFNAWRWNGPASRFASRAASTQPEVASSCRHASHADCINRAFELSAFLLID